jgi:hypothetical protein
VRDVASIVGNLSVASPPAPAAVARSTSVGSDAPPISLAPPAPFEPSPLAATSSSKGPSPFVLILLAVGAVSLGIFLGPRLRRVTGYWVAEARLAFLSRKPPTS